MAVLRAALSAVLARRADHVVVESRRVCGSAAWVGLAVLVEAGTTAAGQGTEYAIGGASRQAGRVWALGWPAAAVPIRFPTAGDGVLAALAHQAGRADRVAHRAEWAPEQLRRAVAAVPGRPADTADAATATDTVPARCAG